MADPIANLKGGFESLIADSEVSLTAKKQRPTSRASFNSDTAALVMADSLANLKANFQSLKADFKSLIIAGPSARTNALRPNWSTNRTGRKVQERCGLQGIVVVVLGLLFFCCVRREDM
jgi:hypothetical protein